MKYSELITKWQSILQDFNLSIVQSSKAIWIEGLNDDTYGAIQKTEGADFHLKKESLMVKGLPEEIIYELEKDLIQIANTELLNREDEIFVAKLNSQIADMYITNNLDLSSNISSALKNIEEFFTNHPILGPEIEKNIFKLVKID